jgi:two-component system OmpR family response regulator
MSNTKLENVMLVEDDVDIQEIAKLALGLVGGLSVTICSSGEEALQKVREAKPQLILLDVMMPNMDGPTTLKQLRLIPEASSIPVIFVTAKVQSHEVASYKKMGAADVISKPFDPMTLSENIRTIWGNIPS